MGGLRGSDAKAVDRRAGQLQGEYLAKARYADRVYGQVPEGQVGPVEQKLVSFGSLRGLVFGPWGEASEGVHRLVDDLAEQRAKRILGVGRSKMACPKGAKGVATGQIRRALSVVAVKAQARLLLDRLCWLGSGAVEAARRRRFEEWEEKRMAKRHRRELAADRGKDFRWRPGSFNSK